jgi:hypothetical protein
MWIAFLRLANLASPFFTHLMIKLKYSISLLLLFFAFTLHAQQSQSFQAYRTYHAAGDLLERGMYVAASAQYRLVIESKKLATSLNLKSELSLLKENSQYYYGALCVRVG